MATYSRILAWEIPWTKEPGGLQSVGSQGVRHDVETERQLQGEGESWETSVFFLNLLKL